jgi:DNA repair protein RadC
MQNQQSYHLTYKIYQMISNVSEIEISYTPTQLSFNRQTIKCSNDFYEVFKQLFDAKLLNVREECFAIFLNRSNRIAGWYKVSSGGITGTVVDIRLTLSIALKSLSSGLLIAHNHPSGNLMPSSIDKGLTVKLKEAANLMDIKLIDHLIITNEGYYSFADEGEV